MPGPSATFASALRGAIERRGLSLDRIQSRLDERGVQVSVATLSYWQSGRRTPGRRSSLAAIPHLEEVLELRSGELLQTLPPTRERARRGGVQDLDALWPESPIVAVLGRLDTSWDVELDRVMMHDLLRVGPDGRHVGLSVRQAMRARRDGPDRRVVLHQQDDACAVLPEFRAVRGCRLGRVEQDGPGGVVAAELVFFEPLRRGETVIVEYELTWAGSGPRDTRYTRRLRTPMRELLLEVEFHPEALPADVRAFTEDRETGIDLDPAHRAALVHTDTAPGTSGVRWSWEPADPS